MKYFASAVFGLIFFTSVLSLPAGEDVAGVTAAEPVPETTPEAVKPAITTHEEKISTEAVPAQVTAEAEKITLSIRFADQKNDVPPEKIEEYSIDAAVSLSNVCPLLLASIAVLIFKML